MIKEAFVKPYMDALSVKEMYGRFTATIVWGIKAGLDEPITSSGLIRDNYRRCVNGEIASPSDVEIGWFEYELRRRVHFAEELLLKALTDTLLDLTEGRLTQVFDEWKAEMSVPPFVYEVFPFATAPFEQTIEGLKSSIPDSAFLIDPPDPGKANALESCSAACYAVALLMACWQQSAELRRCGRIPNRKSYMERAFAILEESSLCTVEETLRELVIQTAIEPHLSNTLRKMGNGQQCSLRFYPEGALLRPTRRLVWEAGCSGDRLGNVLGMLADLGYFQRESGGLQLTEDGKSFLDTE